MASKTQKKGSATAQRPAPSIPEPPVDQPLEQAEQNKSATPATDRRTEAHADGLDHLRPDQPLVADAERPGDADGDDDRAPEKDAAAPKSEVEEPPVDQSLEQADVVRPPERYPVARGYSEQFGQAVDIGYKKWAIPALEPVAAELAADVGLRATSDILRPLTSGERMITVDEVAQLIKGEDNRALFAKALGRYKGQRVGRALCFMVAQAQIDNEAASVAAGASDPDLALLPSTDEGRV